MILLVMNYTFIDLWRGREADITNTCLFCMFDAYCKVEVTEGDN